jgi:tetratricopeptide (TPR) repeat protein
LTSSGEEAAVRNAHAAWCLALAEQADPELAGPQQGVWFARLEADQPNVRAALSWLHKMHDGELGLRVASLMTWFWSSRGYFREASAWLEAFLAMPTSAAARGRGLVEAANIRQWQGDDAGAIAYASEALTILRQQGDHLYAAYAQRRLGSLAINRGDLQQAQRSLAESGEILRALGTPWDAAYALYAEGRLAQKSGDHAGAVARFAEAAKAFAAIGDEGYIAAARGQQ